MNNETLLNVELERYEYADDATFGTLYVPDVSGNVIEFATVELPWLENVRRISCIPEGSYLCQDYSSKRFPNVWEILEVDGRDYILIHAGNSANDVLGCVAVASFRRPGKRYISKSREAIQKLRTLLPSRFRLNITRHVEEYP